MKIKKRVLAINLGWEQEPLLDKLAACDTEIYGIHYNENYYRKIPYHDIMITDLRDLPAIIRYTDKIKPDAVISDQCDYSYFAQALIAEKYNLPGPGIKEAQIATNKFLQRKKTLEFGFLSPDFSLCFSVDDVFNFTKKNGFPIMIKAIDNRGSFGVNKVKNVDEIHNAYYDALINSHSRYVLVEKYIAGTHLTVDGFVFPNLGPKALAVASKTKLNVKDSIIDGEIIYPAQIPEKFYMKAEQALEIISYNFGFKFGFLHGEFILTENGDIYLTEIANRGGGVFTSEIIVPNFTSFDIITAYINNVLGLNYTFLNTDVLTKIPTVLKFFAFESKEEGIVKSIKGIDTIESKKNVLKIKMLIKKGDLIKKVTNGAERHGMIICTDKTVPKMIFNMSETIKNLEVEIEKV